MINTKHTNALINPQGVALVGATERPGSLGSLLLNNLSTVELKSKLFLINPKYKTIKGQTCYKSILDVPDARIDLVILCVPAKGCKSALQELIDSKKVRAVIIIAAGFKEAGSEGIALENELVQLANEGDIGIIGPNCLGIQSPYSGLNASFAATTATTGRVAFLSQSGAICCSVLDFCEQFKAGFRAFISIGSMCHIKWHNLIDYFADDDLTDAIFIYMETIGDAENFFKAAIKAKSKNKQIIVLKPGKSESASKAVASHTGSMVGDHKSFLAFMEACGVVVIDSLSLLNNLFLLYNSTYKPLSNKAYIMTNAGGPGVICCDTCSEYNISLINIPDKLKQSLDEILPAAWSKSNPIDILGDANPELYQKALECVLEHGDSKTALLLLLTPQATTMPTKTASLLIETIKKYVDRRAPIICSWQGGSVVQDGFVMINNNHIPAVMYADEAAQLLATSIKATFSKPITPTVIVKSLSRINNVKSLIESANLTKSKYLTETVAKSIFKLYKINVCESIIGNDLRSCLAAAEKIGYPVVAKLHSSVLTHKSDVDGVVLNIQSPEALREAYNTISNCTAAENIEGICIQKMINLSNGLELLLGSYFDDQFGPMVVFGMGGTLVEVVSDTTVFPCFLNPNDIHNYIKKTKIYKALSSDNTKRYKGCDLDNLCSTIHMFSIMVYELQDMFAECEINPMYVDAKNLIALDARIILK